jgi:hypothetical protein
MKNFIYLNWDTINANKALTFKADIYDTVEVTTSVGPYKNLFADFVL